MLSPGYFNDLKTSNKVMFHRFQKEKVYFTKNPILKILILYIDIIQTPT